MTVDDYLRSVGKKCFIDYYELFQNLNIDRHIIINALQKEGLTPASCDTKASDGRQIFIKNLEIATLKNIIKSKKIDTTIKEKAEVFLAEILDEEIDQEEQANWIISSNPEVYDSVRAFKNLPEIDWGNAANNNINVGDIVYIYITQPEQRIAIKTEVIKTDFTQNELLGNDGQFNIGNVRTLDRYFRLKLLKHIDSEALNIDRLHENGINGNIQGKRKIDGNTLKYILYHESTIDNLNNVIAVEKLKEELDKDILTSRYTPHNSREERLEKASKIPEEIKIISRGFKRNSDVVVAVLERAGGFCERCECKAPFIRRDNTPYLEVHHIVMLANGGEDSVENAIAVCPNCHRELHYGI